MYARMVTIQGKPDKVEAAIHNLKENVVPTVKKMPGFKSMNLLVDRKSGKTVVVVFWETEKNMLDSLPATAPLREQSAKISGAANPPTVEHFEVAVQS